MEEQTPLCYADGVGLLAVKIRPRTSIIGRSIFHLMAATIPTAPFHGYQVLFSPYSPHKLAFTGARNYGIAGEDATCKILVGGPRAGKFPWGEGGYHESCFHALLVHPPLGSGVLMLYEENESGFRECGRSVTSS